MKNITKNEQKKILLELLYYIDKICEEKNIKYSLIGGSLIGAIRHKGIIPWDDDIDIVLMPEEYKKLINELKKEKKYKLLIPDINDNYPYPFAKIIDDNSIVIENKQRQFGFYGIYVDIFQYRYLSNSKVIRFLQYKYISILKILLCASMLKDDEIKKEKSIIKKIRNGIANYIGVFNIRKKYIKFYNYSKKSNYIVSNWPAYGYSKEIQYTKNMELYERKEFENITAMVTSNYDALLKTTFGDYMKLPPKEKRKSNHNIKVYWRDDNEKNKK